MTLLKWSSDTVSLRPPIPRGLSSPPKKKPEALRMAYGAVHDLLFPRPPSSTLNPSSCRSSFTYSPGLIGLLAVPQTDQTYSYPRAFALAIPSAQCALPPALWMSRFLMASHFCSAITLPPGPSLTTLYQAAVPSHRCFLATSPPRIFSIVLIPVQYTL